MVPPRVRTCPAGGWSLVLPLKGGPTAKSRLRGGPALARAIATDCLDAVLACPAVTRTVVVTAHGPTAAAASVAGADVVPESAPGSGLLAAVHDGLAATPTGPVGVLLGDLPALRPADLKAGLDAVAAALREHPAPMAAVPDAAGTGTVLLAARTAEGLDPAFGPGSLAEHLRRGAIRVDLDAPRLRRDVDTPDDLLVALALGVGPRTAAAIAGIRTAAWPARPTRLRGTGGPGVYSGRVQATVYSFDPTTGSGSVVTDDGEVLPLDGKALDESPLRLLRPGQRLTVSVEGAGKDARVTGLALGSVGVMAAKPSRP